MSYSNIGAREQELVALVMAELKLDPVTAQQLVDAIEAYANALIDDAFERHEGRGDYSHEL